MINLSRKNSVSAGEISDLLAHIPSHETYTCLKVGSALKNEFGSHGYPLFYQFCSKADNFDSAWVEANWRSVNAQKATIGLIFHLAKTYDTRVCGTYADPINAQSIPQKVNQDSESRIRVARKIWKNSKTSDRVVANHPYAIKKEIYWAAGAGRSTVSGSLLGKNSDCLVIPVYDFLSDALQGVQCINGEGKKQSFGVLKGGGLILGNSLRHDQTWAIAEGWASTVACVHWLNFDCAICSFGKNRYDEVTELVVSRFNPLAIKRFRECDD